MAILIASFSEDKKTEAHVKKVIELENWEKIIIVSEAQTKIDTKKTVDYIYVNMTKRLPELSSEIMTKIRNKLKGIDVAVNIISGSGKLHMALLSAILKLGYGIRFIALTEQGIKEV